MIARVALVLVLLAPMSAQATDLFAQPATVAQLRVALAEPIRQLGRASSVRGRYQQLKHLDGFPQPLQSSGTFLFVRDLGVIWHTAEPFESEFVLDAAGVRDAGMNHGASAQPVLRMVSSVFVALFELDLDVLSAQFHLFSEPAANGWTLGLRPRDASVAAVADRIGVRGGAQIEHIELSDARGDRTEIRLSDVVADDAAASAADRARFAR